MGAPIHAPGMRGATTHVFEDYEDTYRGTEVVREGAPVRQWSHSKELPGGITIVSFGWFAFRRAPDGIQIAYVGHHPADIPRKLWREWFGAAHDLEFWNAARRELRITNHPPKGTVH